MNTKTAHLSFVIGTAKYHHRIVDHHSTTLPYFCLRTKSKLEVFKDLTDRVDFDCLHCLVKQVEAFPHKPFNVVFVFRTSMFFDVVAEVVVAPFGVVVFVGSHS